MSASGSYGAGGSMPIGPTIDTLTGNNIGFPVGPDGLNNVNILGAGGLTVTGNPGTNTLTITATGIANQYDEDVGSATPALGILNIIGGASTAGININTSGAGNTVSIILNDSLLFPNTNAAGTQGVLFWGGNRFVHNFGTNNVFIGSNAGNLTLTTASENSVLGAASARSLTTGDQNTIVGFNSFPDDGEGSFNSTLGTGTLLSSIGNCNYNTAVGFRALDSLGSILPGSFNTALGVCFDGIQFSGAGTNYVSNESSNLILMHPGVVGESHVLRIGTDGAGDTQQDACYIAGIYNRAFASPSGVVQIDSNFKLGSSSGLDGQLLIGDTGGSAVWANLTSVGGTVTITNGAGTINLEAVGGGGGGTVAFPTDVGTANEVGGVVNIFSGATSAFNNMNTAAVGNTVYVRMNDSIGFPNTNAAGTTGLYSLGGNRFMHNYGAGNTFLGENAGNLTLTPASAFDNVALGQSVLSVITTASENVILGSQGGTAVTTGAANCGVGFGVLDNLTTGQSNIAIGPLAGTNYTTESNNIAINNFGTAADSGAIRIGRNGVHTSAYMQGIYGASVGATNATVIIDNNGKLGTTSSGGGGTPIAFFAYQNGDINNFRSLTPVTLGTLVAFSTIFDTGSNFYPGDGAGSPCTFTAPVTGQYYLAMQGVFLGSYNQGRWKNTITISGTTNRVYVDDYLSITTPVGAFKTHMTNQIVHMTAGDTATFAIDASATTTNFNLIGGTNAAPLTSVSGFLINNTVSASALENSSFMAVVDGTESLSGSTTITGTFFVGAQKVMTTVYDNFSGAFFPGDGGGTPASFTAPVNGFYQFNWSVQISPTTSGTELTPTINVNGSPYASLSCPRFQGSGGMNRWTQNITTLISLTASDVVTFSAIISVSTTNPNGGFVGGPTPHVTSLHGILLKAA